MTRRMGLVVCGAGPASHVDRFIDQAHAQGWSVRVILTPAARAFVDEDALAAQTGEPVRFAHRAAGAPRSQPVDLFVVAPATANTINKLALGIADTYALDLLTEAIGRGQPVIILPFVNTALAARVPFQRHIDALREEGVHVLIGPGLLEPHSIGTGSELLHNYPWHVAIARAAESLPETH